MRAGATIAASALLGPSAWDLPLGIVAGLMVLGGLQLVAVGLLAELSVRTYHEARGRPIYLVAEERAGLAGEPGAEQPAAAGAG